MEPNRKPFADKLGEERRVGFMFMGRVNGINLYNHGIARTCLNLDDSGQCYVCREKWRFEKADFDTQLRKPEATRATRGDFEKCPRCGVHRATEKGFAKGRHFARTN